MELEEFLKKLATTPEHAGLLKSVRKDAGHSKNLLLLSCIDLRYPDVIHTCMEPRFHKRYDHVSLAGAGLAPVVDFGADRKPHWQQTFLEHVAISIALHSIKAVIVMDHRDCGAYQKFGLLTDQESGSKKEATVHFQQMRRLRALLKSEFPKLAFYGILLPIEPKRDEKTGKVIGLDVELLT